MKVLCLRLNHDKNEMITDNFHELFYNDRYELLI